MTILRKKISREDQFVKVTTIQSYDNNNMITKTQEIILAGIALKFQRNRDKKLSILYNI